MGKSCPGGSRGLWDTGIPTSVQGHIPCQRGDRTWVLQPDKVLEADTVPSDEVFRKWLDRRNFAV